MEDGIGINYVVEFVEWKVLVGFVVYVVFFEIVIIKGEFEKEGGC